MNRAWLLLALVCLLAANPRFAAAHPVQEDLSALLMKANEAYRAQRFETAADLYEQAGATGSDQPVTLYNAACSAALVGQVDRAYRNLDRAIDLGFVDADNLSRDSDLVSLHGDPRWESTVEKIEAAAMAFQNRWHSTALMVPFQENLSDAAKAAGLSKIWSEVAFNFVNFHLVPELDWDALYMEFMPRVLQTRSTREYYGVLREFIAHLDDAHTNVYVPAPLWGQMNARPGLRTRLIEGKVMVIEVTDDAIEGVDVGDEILAIDEVPVREYAAEFVAPYVAASTSQDRETRLYGSHLLRGDAADEVSLRLTNAQGETYERSVRRGNQPAWARRISRPPFRLTMHGEIAHVELNTFAGDGAATALEKELAKLAAAEGIVLDLRENGGGNSAVGWRILAHFTDAPFPTTQWHTLQYRPAHRAWGRQPQSRFGASRPLHAADASSYIDTPIVMLIGPGTFSAAEDMAASFDMMKRGVLMGEASGGSTGQPLAFDLPGGGKARVCTKHDMYADGTPFVGVGIQPDIEVVPSVKDFRAGIDTVLEAALEHFSR